MDPALHPRHRAPRSLTHVGAGILLVLFACWAYCNCLAAPFVFDDVPLIYENPALLHFWPATSLGERRFIGHLTFALNRQWGGLAPLGYHLVNVGLHAVAGLLLFGLARRTLLLPGVPARYGRAATYLAFAMALLWLVHPLQTAAVTYTIQRLEVLASLFYLLMLYALARAATAPRSWPWCAAAVLACWLGLATKEVMLTAPFVAALYDRIYLAGSWRSVWRARAVVYAACLPPLLWVLLGATRESTGTAVASVGLGVPNVTPWRYLLTQSEVITHYLKLVFVPAPLCLDYNWIPAQHLRDVWPAFLFVSLLLALTLFALWRWPRAGFLGAAFFAILAPTSSIVPLADAAFEHRMYLPLAAVIALLVLAARDVWRWAFARYSRQFAGTAHPSRAARHAAADRANLVRRVLALALLHFTSQALLVRTLQRNKEYGNYVSLWRSAVNAAPWNHRARINYGGALYAARQPELAEQQLLLSIATVPTPQAFTYLGLIAQERNEAASARQYFAQALKVDEHFAPAHICLARLAEREHDLAAAKQHLLEAIRLAPQQAPAYLNLAQVELQEHRPREALAHLQRAAALWPEHAATLTELTWLTATSRDDQVFQPAAAQQYAERLRAAPTQAAPAVHRLEALAAAAAANQDFAAAEELAGEAAQLAANTGHPEAALLLRQRAAQYAAGTVVRMP